MAELRWILLLAGLVFLAALTAWELRRPRQAHGAVSGRAERSEPTYGTGNEYGTGGEMELTTTSLGAAQLTIPTGPVGEPTWDHEPEYERYESHRARVPVPEPVQVQLPPMDTSLDSPMESFPDSIVQPPLVVSFDEPVLPREQEIPTLEPEIGSLASAQQPEPYAELESQQVQFEPVHVQTPHGDATAPTLHPAGDYEPAPDCAEPAAEPVDPIVDWPPEEQRHILAVRVVGLSADRMSGRPLRQALSACGFVHGRFGIFHQPGADGRALISAANLNKPGVFDPANMDFERFRGLGLFAVLPGPLPPAAALDHLLDTAGDLAQRLHARLQDEHGMPLDEERLEAMARIVQSMTQGGLRAEPAA
jgi:cell division protein ZipA